MRFLIDIDYVFVAGYVTRRVTLVEQELFTLPEHMRFASGICVSKSC
jgi:hypothetical protein